MSHGMTFLRETGWKPAVEVRPIGKKKKQKGAHSAATSKEWTTSAYLSLNASAANP